MRLRQSPSLNQLEAAIEDKERTTWDETMCGLRQPLQCCAQARPQRGHRTQRKSIDGGHLEARKPHCLSLPGILVAPLHTHDPARPKHSIYSRRGASLTPWIGFKDSTKGRIGPCGYLQTVDLTVLLDSLLMMNTNTLGQVLTHAC